MPQLHKCPGFTAVWIADALREKVIYDGKWCYRSRSCGGSFLKKRSVVRCSKCQAVRNDIEARKKRLSGRQEWCLGLERSAFESLIKRRQWETERKDYSLVRIRNDRLFSLHCKGEKERTRQWCDECQKTKYALQTLLRRDNSRPINEDSRILSSNVKYLTEADKIRKKTLLRMRRLKSASLLANTPKRMKIELNLYIPKVEINKKVAQSIRAHLNSRRKKLKPPKCLWTSNHGTECGEQAETYSNLFKHFVDVHLKPQNAENAETELLLRQYVRKWSKIFERH